MKKTVKRVDMNRVVCHVLILAFAVQGVAVSAQSRPMPDSVFRIALRLAAEREVVRFQLPSQPQPPPRPADIIPTQSAGRRKCSWIKGVSIGARVGGGVGMAAGAITGNPNDIGGRLFPAMAYGIVGAGIGAVIGFSYCR
jgi:hypothetical protein